MILPDVKERILRGLDRISPEMQTRIADYVEGVAHALSGQESTSRAKPEIGALRATRPPGLPGSALGEIFGTLDAETAQMMREAIEEDCEHIDPDEW